MSNYLLDKVSVDSLLRNLLLFCVVYLLCKVVLFENMDINQSNNVVVPAPAVPKIVNNGTIGSIVVNVHGARTENEAWTDGKNYAIVYQYLKENVKDIN